MNHLERKKQLKQKALSADCSREELAELYFLIKNHGTAHELDDLFTKGWYDENHLIRLEKESSKKILENINRSIAGKPDNSRKRQFFKVAASVALIALSIFVLQHYNNQSEAVVMLTKVAEKGIVKTVLGDGTVVWINSQSGIKYPEEFDGERRVIELNGEAFFDVARDEKRPFLIKTGNFTTRVLGTSFNVQTYNDAYQVTVASGKVQVKHGQDSVLLIKNQRLAYDSNKNKFIKTQVSPQNYSDWRFGVIRLQGKLAEATKILERRFGVNVVFEESKIKQYEIDATYTNESLRNILKSIEFTMGVKTAVENDTVKVY